MPGGCGGPSGGSSNILDEQGRIVGIDWQLPDGEYRQFSNLTGRWATVRAATLPRPETRTAAIMPIKQIEPLAAAPANAPHRIPAEISTRTLKSQPAWYIKLIEMKRAVLGF